MTETSRLLGGRYEVGEPIGRGGMAEVHLGYDTRLGRQVAIKILRSDHARDTSFLHRFRKEAQSVAGLNHPNIVAVYDSGEEMLVESGGGDIDIPYIVMEFVDGHTLREVLNADGPLEPDRALGIVEGVLAALEYSHRMGIVHRDIKPGNILIADRGKSLGTVKISDFGIARAKSDVSDTQDEVITGTPAYFAPEVARGDDPTEASDVFSLGSTLYTVIEGQPPFGIDSDAIALLHRVAKAEIYRPTKSGPLTDVLLQLLEPDPTRRPTMAQARDALAAAATGGGTIEQLIDAPVYSSEGAVPAWAHRTTQLADPHRRNRLTGSTITGLPAVQQNTPLRNVPSPMDMFSWPPRIPTGPADASTRDKVVAWAPLAMTGMVAVIILAALIVVILVFTA